MQPAARAPLLALAALALALLAAAPQAQAQQAAWPPSFCSGLECPRFQTAQQLAAAGGGSGAELRSYEPGESRVRGRQELRRSGDTTGAVGWSRVHLKGVWTATVPLPRPTNPGPCRMLPPSPAPAAVWVSTRVNDTDYERATGTGFQRLFAYISGANAEKRKIAMTAPVRVQLTPGQVSFYLPDDLQKNPPAPTSKDVFIDPAPATQLYVLSYGGRSNQKQVIDKATELLKLLEERGLSYDYSHFYSAGYDSPFRILNRHNEVWVAAAPAKR
ncbi:hypothetical protein HYH03_006796 [Edaphochlamys debaryana]|uniref:SOUL heme-binding protein n=1 Tax=Edaphochlamys debaryana TaxID=47281 RepID=A0A836BZZ2_9CHLO|nr:hypothetical protein HYH03_006796 [Edaphochlamys debaryana]|eukprot:KAG2495190.1 hypothetical protein HYH03_006796 [Edaphochlamys debaryana]